jgi:hypothetical protein
MSATPPITVRTGTAEPASMAFAPGTPVGPLAVGRNATWRVVAPGVLEEHGFLYFDGTSLFLQSANPNAPITVNGAPIPSTWTPVYAPCEIAFGGARLWFGPTAASMAPPRPEAPPSRAGFIPRINGLDDNDEHTRMQPIEEMQASRRSVNLAPREAVSATLKSSDASPFAPSTEMMGPGPLFGPPPPASIPGPGSQAAPVVFPGPGAPPDASPPGPPAPKPPGWLAARWREASGPKKALTVLMVPLVWAVWVIFTDKAAPPRPLKPVAAASVSAKPSAAPSVEPPAPQPVQPAASPASSASAKPAAGPASSAKTPQREAADAVAAGAYDKAAKLYEDLAKANPGVPVYAEAARIMRAKGKR